jgi:hypothetical protein
MKNDKYKNEHGTLNSDRSIEISQFIIECNKKGVFEMTEIISAFAESKEHGKWDYSVYNPKKWFFREADMKGLDKQHSLGEISYGKMVELINQKAYDFLKALSSPNEDKNGWISVDDRLPDESLGVYGLGENYVRVIGWDGKFAQEILYNFNYKKFYDSEYDSVVGFTHWMPLPQPPTQTGNNKGKENERN